MIGDLKNPRSCWAFGAVKCMAVPVDQQKDILDLIVCLGGVSEDPDGHSPDEPGIAPEKDGQRFPAALADLNDQGFVEGFGVYG